MKNSALIRIFLGLVSLFAAPAHATEAGEAEAPEIREIAKGKCSELTFEESAEMVSRSMEDAAACMGERWVRDGLGSETISTATVPSADVDVSARRVTVIDRNGRVQFYLLPMVNGHVAKERSITPPEGLVNGHVKKEMGKDRSTPPIQFVNGHVAKERSMTPPEGLVNGHVKKEMGKDRF